MFNIFFFFLFSWVCPVFFICGKVSTLQQTEHNYPMVNGMDWPIAMETMITSIIIIIMMMRGSELVKEWVDGWNYVPVQWWWLTLYSAQWTRVEATTTRMTTPHLDNGFLVERIIEHNLLRVAQFRRSRRVKSMTSCHQGTNNTINGDVSDCY